MVYFDRQTDNLHICVWHVTESLEELFALLPDDITVRQEAERRFRSIPRQIEWVAVRVLLCKMLNRQVPILYDNEGAPYLADYEHLDISISHTKGYVAVALAAHGAVGIDVEHRSERVIRVRDRFLASDEEAPTLTSLLLHWSAKETAFKMLHRRKVNFLKDLHVIPFSEQQHGAFDLQETYTDNEETLRIHYAVFPDFVLTYSLVQQP